MRFLEFDMTFGGNKQSKLKSHLDSIKFESDEMQLKDVFDFISSNLRCLDYKGKLPLNWENMVFGNNLERFEIYTKQINNWKSLSEFLRCQHKNFRMNISADRRTINMKWFVFNGFYTVRDVDEKKLFT